MCADVSAALMQSCLDYPYRAHDADGSELGEFLKRLISKAEEDRTTAGQTWLGARGRLCSPEMAISTWRNQRATALTAVEIETDSYEPQRPTRTV